ncbi:hypothetical protein MKY29_16345 [Psychrobacillus sp. FSL K6-2365]|uniref:hypothetical protein n=1 Tax=unclassified Psychrobacillus TaxID=2636677 RepID=UPI0030F75E45
MTFLIEVKDLLPITQTGAVGKNYTDHFLSMAFGFFDNELFNDYAEAVALGVS